MLGGTVTLSLTTPVVHGVVAGNPATGLFEVNVQLVAFATPADKATRPPADVSEEGVAVKKAIEGGVEIIPVAPTGGRLRAETAPIAMRPVMIGISRPLLTLTPIQARQPSCATARP